MAEITKRSADLDARNNRIDELQRMNDEMSRHLTGRNKELESSKSTITKCLAVVKELLIEKSRIERKDARAKCMQNRLRLGQFVTQRVGATFQVRQILKSYYRGSQNSADSISAAIVLVRFQNRTK